MEICDIKTTNMTNLNDPLPGIPSSGIVQPPTTPKGSGYKITPELKFMRRKVLPALLSHPFSGPFRCPVNAKKEGIYPDYFKVVNNPMDLMTVRTRLDKGWYWDLAGCVADINQVWENSRLYNPPSHDIHKWSLAMGSVTRAWLDKMPVKKSNSEKKNKELKVFKNEAKSKAMKETSPRSTTDIKISPRAFTDIKTSPKAATDIKISPLTPDKANSTGSRDNTSLNNHRYNLRVCENILDTLMTDPTLLSSCSSPFLSIRPQTSQDTYSPTDLASIRTNLAEGRYNTANQVAKDFRRMISETYRFCIDKDPILDQARELHHQFEMAFSKRVDMSVEDDIHLANEDETETLQNILNIGRAMEMEIDQMVERETEILERKRFNQARLLVKEIEGVGPEVMEMVVKIIQDNNEPLDVEEDGTLVVSYESLSSRTISSIRKQIRHWRLGEMTTK